MKPRDYGKMVGKVMQKHPTHDARVVNDVVRVVLEEIVLAMDKCPKCEVGISPHRNCVMR